MLIFAHCEYVKRKIRKMLISSKIIDRILELKGFKTDVKLAKYWNVSPTAVTSWRTRNSIPFKRIIAFCEDEGVPLDYIFTGEGKRTRGAESEKKMQVAEEASIYKVGVLDDDPETAGLVKMTREILKSGTDYSASLAANIRSFHHAIKTEKRLLTVESRLEVVEKRLKEIPEENTEKKAM